MAPRITTDANYLACKCRTLENSLEREFSREFNRVCKRAFEDNSRDNSINRSINRSINPSIDQSIDQSIHQSCDQSINRPSPFLSLWLCCAVLCCGVCSLFFLASLTTKESRSPQCRRSHIHVSTTIRRAENAQIILTAHITPAPAARPIAAHIPEASYAQESRLPMSINSLPTPRGHPQRGVEGRI